MILRLREGESEEQGESKREQGESKREQGESKKQRECKEQESERARESKEQGEIEELAKGDWTPKREALQY